MRQTLAETFYKITCKIPKCQVIKDKKNEETISDKGMTTEGNI